jgi:hypothetical protein
MLLAQCVPSLSVACTYCCCKCGMQCREDSRLHNRHCGIEMGSPPEHATAELVPGTVPDSSNPLWLEHEEAQQQQQQQQQAQQHVSDIPPVQDSHLLGGNKPAHRSRENSMGGLEAPSAQVVNSDMSRRVSSCSCPAAL